MLTEYPRRCAGSPYGERLVHSLTSEKVYVVELRPDGRNLCTCIAFAIRRNKLGGNVAIGRPECTCKHIEDLKDSGCGWNSETGTEQEYPAICPACYNNVVEYDNRTLETDADSLYESFLANAQRLKAMRQR